MGNRQFGFMLSGGLDSSLIAGNCAICPLLQLPFPSALATRFLHSNDFCASPIAFSVGFEDSPDLVNARKVAEYLGICHRVLVISARECVEAIPGPLFALSALSPPFRSEVVFSLETFDPLVVRCGVAHFLLCKHIAASSEVKVLLSGTLNSPKVRFIAFPGEGADELFGSYAYMQRAPSAPLLQREIVRRLRLLHQYDVLRCDRCFVCSAFPLLICHSVALPAMGLKFGSLSSTKNSFLLLPNFRQGFSINLSFICP